MKITIYLILVLSYTQTIYAKNFSFTLTNNTGFPIQVSSQLIKGIEKDNPNFLFILNPKESKPFDLKLKNGEKIKFIGTGGGIETLPLVKDFEMLSSKKTNEYQLVAPVIDKLNVIELNDAIAKIKNDNILKILMDTVKYSKDEMPSLGTFLFINRKNQSVLPLTSSFWKNEELIRNIDNQYFNTTSYINSSNASGLSVSGVPFLRSLSSSFTNSNIMEVVWDIQNAHIEQWQPSDKNVYQIIEDPKNDLFIRSCVTQMKEQNLAGGDYQLLFISSVYVVDKIKISGRKYNSFSFNADIDFQIPPTGVEVVQPIGVDASFKYTRVQQYKNIDSTLNAHLKFLAQDYTSALNAHLTQQERNAQKNAAILKLETHKKAIISQYSALRAIDNTLIETEIIDVIIPITISTPEIDLKVESNDSLGNNISPQITLDFNKKARQYNSILKSIKENISSYSLSFESIDKLNQLEQTNYQRINNLTTTIELDPIIIEQYIRYNKP